MNIKRIWENIHWGVKLVGGTALAGLFAGYMYRQYDRSNRKVFPPNTVVFRCFGPSVHVPSLSPFAMKLETYMRMAKLPYESVITYKSSPKGKFPWIEYNDKALGDSGFIIEFLNKEKGVDLNSHLTPEEKGIGRAFQKMIEENTYWALEMDRCVFHTEDAVKAFGIPWPVSAYIKYTIRGQARGQGIGRHTVEEIYQIFRTDLEAVSRFLGSKKFLFGDRPCQYDCTIFGLLSVARWEGFDGRVTPILEEFPNLCEYCDRMREEFWPDWDECTLEGQNKNKSKS